jgi:hypothetical protein
MLRIMNLRSGGSSYDLPSATWGNLGSSLGDSGGYDFSVGNAFLDDQTFSYNNNSYTMFKQEDRITLPNLPAYGFGASNIGEVFRGIGNFPLQNAHLSPLPNSVVYAHASLN